MGDKAAIELNNVTFQYFRADKPALRNIDLKVYEGEFLGIMGPTGAGKSTLLYLMSGTIPHFFKGTLTGEVLVGGRDTKDLSWSEILKVVGLILDDPEAQLFSLFVRDELIWGLENRGLPKEKILESVDRVVNLFGIKHLTDRVSYDLSGGEKQKIAIASVYALQPDILLLDEPTSQLDPVGTKLVYDAIADIAATGKTIVLVEHKAEELAEFADRIILLNEGELLLDENSRNFFANRELLRSAGIDIPQVGELAYELKETVPISSIPLTIDEAVSTFKRLLRIDD